MSPIDHSSLRLLSSVIGWVYFSSWTASFYPQVILNYQTKSTKGFSIDFALPNVLGYISLTTFNVALRFFSFVRQQYGARHDGHHPTVSYSDVAFAVHALILSTASLSQMLYYPSTQRLSTYNKIAVPIMALLVASGAALTYSGVRGLQLLDFLYLFSYLKLYITFTKYIPQAYLNYNRKSTEGWSIVNIYLDLIGGTLSCVQLFLDAWLDGDVWGGTFGNPSKLGMSVFTFAFDSLFIFQHYVLYPNPPISSDPKLVTEAEGEDEVVDERTPLV